MAPSLTGTLINRGIPGSAFPSSFFASGVSLAGRELHCLYSTLPPLLTQQLQRASSLSRSGRGLSGFSFSSAARILPRPSPALGNRTFLHPTSKHLGGLLPSTSSLYFRDCKLASSFASIGFLRFFGSHHQHLKILFHIKSQNSGL